MKKISVLLADKELEYVASIQEKLKNSEANLVGFAVSLSGVTSKCAELQPDIVILDTSLTHQDEEILVKDLIAKFPEIKWAIMASGESIQHPNILFWNQRTDIAEFRNNLDNFIINLFAQYKKVTKPKENSNAASKIGAMGRLKALSNLNKPLLLALGASTGGPKALNILLAKLPKDFSLPIVICQHVPPNFSDNLIETLQRGVEIKLIEGQRGIELEAGTAIVAPGGSHMIVKRNPQGKLYIDLHDKEPVQNCKPSVDVLFSSIAENVNAKVIAVILTGMGSDGVDGLKELKHLDSHTIAEAKETCVVFGMPMEAIKAGIVDSILPIDKIAEKIIEIIASYN